MVIRKELLDWFNSQEGKWFKKQLAAGDTPDSAVVEAYERGSLRQVREVVAYLASKDANFLRHYP